MTRGSFFIFRGKKIRPGKKIELPGRAIVRVIFPLPGLFYLPLDGARRGKMAETETKYVVRELRYNRYKGSGKAWIAKVDPETKKILEFLGTEARVPRDGYSGYKVFKVPLTEGMKYLFCESGTKTSDNRTYFSVVNGNLISQTE